MRLPSSTCLPPAVYGGKLACLLLAAACLRTAAATAAPDEEAFLRLWVLHRQAAASSNHLAVAEACREAARSSDNARASRLGRFLPAARTIEGWHWLQAGRVREAAAAYESVLTGPPADPLAGAAEAMARRWLSRLDRELVVAALAAYYREQVAFPPVLAAFESGPAAQRPPLRDRQGDAWIYQLQTFRRLKLDGAQRYLLYSRSIGRETSALAAALALRPPAAAVSFVRKGAGSPAVAEIRIGGPSTSPAIVQEGARAHGLVFAAIGGSGRFAILSDDDFWLMALPPEGNRP